VGVQPKSFLSLVFRLRAFKPDLVLCFHATPRTALAAFLSGARSRVVRNHSGRDWFSTIPVPAPKEAKGAHLRDLDLVDALSPPSAPPEEKERLIREGFLGLPASTMERARRRVAEWGPRPPIVLCPGASKPTNEWPVDRWVELARTLGEEGEIPVLHAGPGEGRWISAFEAAGVSFHRLESPDLPLLAGIFELSRLCIASDSGPKHLAAAAGCPTVTIWGSTLFREWHPYDPVRHPALLAPVPCRPCFLNRCGHLSCLRGIEVAEVLARVRSFPSP
jgi:ADP-heptose:LPS heptosyltransferase